MPEGTSVVVLERGDIYFAYRPRVDEPVVRDLDDVQRFYNDTHLASMLELPEEPGEVQRAFNIAREASYVATVRNPKAPAARGTGLDETRRAEFPRNLRMRFKGRRFTDLDPPDFLDHEGAEILLVGAKPTVLDALGRVVDPERETEATAEIFNELLMEKSVRPVAPLLSGRWE